MGAASVSTLGESRSRGDAAGGIEAPAASWTMGAENDRSPQHPAGDESQLIKRHQRTGRRGRAGQASPRPEPGAVSAGPARRTPGPALHSGAA